MAPRGATEILAPGSPQVEIPGAVLTGLELPVEGYILHCAQPSPHRIERELHGIAVQMLQPELALWQLHPDWTVLPEQRADPGLNSVPLRPDRCPGALSSSRRTADCAGGVGAAKRCEAGLRRCLVTPKRGVVDDERRVV